MGGFKQILTQFLRMFTAKLRIIQKTLILLFPFLLDISWDYFLIVWIMQNHVNHDELILVSKVSFCLAFFLESLYVEILSYLFRFCFFFLSLFFPLCLSSFLDFCNAPSNLMPLFKQSLVSRTQKRLCFDPAKNKCYIICVISIEKGYLECTHR